MDNTHQDKLRFVADMDAMQLVVHCSHALPDLDKDQIEEAMAAQGFGRCQPDTKQLEAVIAAAREAAVDGKALCPVEDGACHVTVSSDGLSASLRVSPARGGKPANLAMALNALAEAEIIEGLDKDAVKRVVTQADDRDHEVARGQAAEDGADAYFQPLVPDMIDRRPRIDDSERADFRDLGGVITVNAGDPLIRRHPPTEGTPGTDVHGLPIPPKPGANRSFKATAKGVQVDEGDPDLLIAAIDGQPIWKKETVMVSPTLDLDQVDLSTGNIDFNGTVRVRGDVAYGMRVRATDDIQISGMVEGARLDAGGDIVIRGGVIGQRRQGSDEFNALLRCEGSLEARFLEHVQVQCGTDVLIRDLVVHCDVEAGEKIIVGSKNTRKGHVMGGRYEAFELIRAVQLGSPSSVETQLRVGNQFRLKKRVRQLADRLRDGRLPPEEVEFTKTRQGELGEVLARIKETACIIAKDAVFTRVSMQIGTSTRLFTTDEPGGTYRRRHNTVELDVNA